MWCDPSWDDYPRNRGEFEARFSTETSWEYLVKLRWPDGFQCPRCDGRKSWPVRRILLQCTGCGYQSSVTAGTIFQDMRKTGNALVSGDVGCDEPEERCQRHRDPEGVGLGQLR
jgi:hypothetical protein